LVNKKTLTQHTLCEVGGFSGWSMTFV